MLLVGNRIRFIACVKQEFLIQLLSLALTASILHSFLTILVTCTEKTDREELDGWGRRRRNSSTRIYLREKKRHQIRSVGLFVRPSVVRNGSRARDYQEAVLAGWLAGWLVVYNVHCDTLFVWYRLDTWRTVTRKRSMNVVCATSTPDISRMKQAWQRRRTLKAYPRDIVDIEMKAVFNSIQSVRKLEIQYVLRRGHTEVNKLQFAVKRHPYDKI